MKTDLQKLEAIENAVKLARFTDAYMNHVLGLYLSLTK